jgi:hypothetical protein
MERAARITPMTPVSRLAFADCMTAGILTHPLSSRAKVLSSTYFCQLVLMQIHFWMILSGNAKAAFPSKTTAIVAAAKLPTPACYYCRYFY